MTIKITEETEKQIEVREPSFWRHGNNWVALINKETVIVLYKSENLVAVRSASAEMLKGDIATANSRYELCTEEEFLTAYANVLKSISLEPTLV
jgi:hypothetical protein